jgi:hypothetical protein
MTQKLRQGTAVSVVIQGVVEADALTPAVLSLAATDIGITRNGVFSGTKNDTSLSENIYDKGLGITFNAVDTADICMFDVEVLGNTTIMPIFKSFEVVSQAKFDADIAGPVTVALLDASLATFFDGVTYTYAQSLLISDCWSRGTIASDETLLTGTITLGAVVISYTFTTAGAREITGIAGV